MNKSIFLSALALVAFAGCSKTEVKPVEDAPAQISWNAVVGKASTKAMIDDTKYPVTEHFGTFAFFNQNGDFSTNFADASKYIYNEEVSNPTEVESGNAWKTGVTYYWPKNGKLTFFSYSPYVKLKDVTSCTATDGVTILDWNVYENQDVDVMIADIQIDQTHNLTNGGYNGVPTIFRHKLTQIVKFEIATAADYSNNREEENAKKGDVFFFLNGISINGVKYQGTYNSTNNVDGTHLGAWTPKNDIKNYVWYSNTTSPMAFGYTKKDVSKSDVTSNYLLVLPQTFEKNNGAYIEISYTMRSYNADKSATEQNYTDVPETVKAYLYDIHSTGHYTDGHGTEHAFAMNKKITYTITVDYSNNIIYWAPSVEPWEEETYTVTF